MIRQRKPFSFRLLIILLVLGVFVSACAKSASAPSSASSNSSAPAKSADSSGKANEGNKAGAGRDAKKLIKLKIGYDALTMDSAPLNYAVQKGIFKKYGLDVEPVYVAGGSALTQALVGGNFDIAENGYAPAAQAISAGADLVYVGGVTNKLAFQFIVKPEITDGQQLKGKKIAISRFGSLTDTAATMVVESVGLKRSDVAILQTGGTAERVAAMLSGQVDATLEQHPQTDQLLEKGFKVLAELKDINEHYPNTAFVVTRSYAKQNKDKLKTFFKAFAEGLDDYKKNREEALNITAKYFKLDNVKPLASTYDFYAKQIFPAIPEADLQGIKLVLQELVKTKPEAAKLKAEDLIDSSAIDELKKEGFFDKFKSGK